LHCRRNFGWKNPTPRSAADAGPSFDELMAAFDDPSGWRSPHGKARQEAAKCIREMKEKRAKDVK
jgi:hypothetical protein